MKTQKKFDIFFTIQMMLAILLVECGVYLEQIMKVGVIRSTPTLLIALGIFFGIFALVGWAFTGGLYEWLIEDDKK